jgi:hypothetical protein
VPGFSHTATAASTAFLVVVTVMQWQINVSWNWDLLNLNWLLRRQWLFNNFDPREPCVSNNLYFFNCTAVAGSCLPAHDLLVWLLLEFLT